MSDSSINHFLGKEGRTSFEARLLMLNTHHLRSNAITFKPLPMFIVQAILIPTMIASNIYFFAGLITGLWYLHIAR
jgi:hypothetical protein